MLRSPDPVVILVGGSIEVAAAFGLFSLLDLTADNVAQLGAGLVMIGSALRMFIGQRARRFNPPPTPAVINADPGYTSER